MISDWDFNRQDGYRYRRPYILPKWTKVHAEWTWDDTEGNPRNPNDPPKTVIWGEGSTDEMSGLIIGGVMVEPREEGMMRLFAIGHYFEVDRKAELARKRREAALLQFRPSD